MVLVFSFGSEMDYHKTLRKFYFGFESQPEHLSLYGVMDLT